MIELHEIVDTHFHGWSGFELAKVTDRFSFHITLGGKKASEAFKKR